MSVVSLRTLETKFHKQLKAFLKDLILVFPSDRDIKVISSSINIAMMDDPHHEIVNGFYDVIAPYNEMICSRDDTFFRLDPTEIVSRWSQQTSQYQLFNKLNIYWETLNDTNRKIVWDYFQLLYNLSLEFMNHRSLSSSFSK